MNKARAIIATLQGKLSYCFGTGLMFLGSGQNTCEEKLYKRARLPDDGGFFIFVK